MSAVTTVHIGDKMLTISGDQNLVRTAGDVLKKYFNATSKEADVVEAVLLGASTFEEEVENSGQVSDVGDIDGFVVKEVMETETETTLPAPASVASIGEVTETVTEAEDMPCPALATAKTEENSAQVQEVPALASDGDVGNGSDTETDVQEVREVMAMASLDAV